MSNTYTAPVWLKAKPNAGAEKEVGDADPLARTDVLNRPGKGVYAVFQRLTNTLLDGATVDFTDQTTVSALAASFQAPISLTNSAAGSTTVGDVLAVSSQTAILGDTVSSKQKYVVAPSVIANGVAGRFVYAGVVTARSTGAIAANQYVRKSATARVLEDAGVTVGATTLRPSDAIGIALAAASGNLCLIFLFESAAGSLETGTPATPARAVDTVYQNTSGRKRRVFIALQIDVNANNQADFQIGSANPPATRVGYAGQNAAIGGAIAMWHSVEFEVPNNYYYRVVTVAGVIAAVTAWVEIDE